MTTKRKGDKKYKCLVVFDDCPHCGSPDTEEETHIIDGDQTLCGISSLGEYVEEIRFGDMYDTCPRCRRKLDEFDEATAAGFDGVAEYKAEAKAERARYDYWMKHGNLAGFK